MADVKTLQLGDKKFKVRRPKLGRLKDIVNALGDMAGKNGGELIDASIDLLVVGLQSGHPDISREELSDLETDVQEINAAVAVVLDVAGLQPQDRGAGEAVPQLAVN
jgi:hypothetical protein